jgi:hypothetical protein
VGNIMYRYTAIVALCVAGSSASADELVALQGGSVELSTVHGVVYYTEENDGYRVVATIAASEGGLPVRFVATLAEGQKIAISVPGKLGESGEAVEFTRFGGKLVVTKARAAHDLAARR